MRIVDDNYIHSAIQLVAEETHVLLDIDNVPMLQLMFMAQAAKKNREDRIKAHQAQQAQQQPRMK